MSFVYITHHDENVRDFDKVYIKTERIPLKYSSIYSEKVKKQWQQPFVTLDSDGTKIITNTGKHQRRTMGCAETLVNAPSEFLRKNQGPKWRRLRDHICPKNPDVSKVPRRNEVLPIPPCKGHQEGVPLKRAKDEKLTWLSKEVRVHQNNRICKYVNYVAQNIQDAKKYSKKTFIPHYIDSPTGDRYKFFNSGLIPQYVCKKSFAKIPNYIEKHKKYLKKYNEACKTKTLTLDECTEFIKKQDVHLMSVEERLKITEGLRANLNATMKIFQRLSIYIDTDIKKNRQARIEKEIIQLEKDIQLMENNTVIYISDY